MDVTACTTIKARYLVLALALANAALYCCALPLWEGFDEPFHYGYLETVAVQQHFPVFGKATLSAEIRESFLLVPLSRFLSEHVPGAVSFGDYSKLNRGEKVRLRQALYGLSPDLKRRPSDFVNYEAHQAPLSYVLLAPFDSMLSSVSLPVRVLWLRLLGALVATAMLFAGLTKLTRITGLDCSVQCAVLFCAFGSQMLWASVAHVGNDWLAVPLTLCFLAWLAGAAKENKPQDLLILAGIVTAGLLTKAYFLIFFPVFVALIFFQAAGAYVRWRTAALALAIPVIVSGPWYFRNIFMYGSLSGTQESIRGFGPALVVAALPRVPWLRSLPYFLRGSLWTGNWSFLLFSRATLDVDLVLFGFALLSYAYRSKISWPERWVIAACISLAVGLVYQTCATWMETNGESSSPEPWYWQGIIPCFWVFAFRGLQRSALAGRLCGTLLCLLTAWIAALTYIAKLLPLYAGGFGRSTLRSVADWWLKDAARQDLNTVALAPSLVVYTMLAIFLFLLACATPAVLRRIWAESEAEDQSPLIRRNRY